jgi:hypothetical protein
MYCVLPDLCDRQGNFTKEFIAILDLLSIFLGDRWLNEYRELYISCIILPSGFTPPVRFSAFFFIFPPYLCSQV